MKIERDDPRLTQYAVGEMAGEELIAFEHALAADPAARAEADALRRMASQLETALDQECGEALGSERRGAILAQGASKRGVVFRRITAAAAVLIAGTIVFAAAQHNKRASNERAASDHQPAEDLDVDPTQPEDLPKPDAGPVAETKTTSVAPRIHELSGKDDRITVRGAPKLGKGTVSRAAEWVERDEEWRRALEASKQKLRELTAIQGSKAELERVLHDVTLHKRRFIGLLTTELTPQQKQQLKLRSTFGYFILTTDPVTGEKYDPARSNPFRKVSREDSSTFSIDVDTASYANVRRLLREGKLPPLGAVRVEELLNYFSYGYTAPSLANAHPFAWHTEIADCPWNAKHKLVRIALQAKRKVFAKRPSANLVFLIDVSGSMRDANKLPLLQKALKLLVDRLDEGDRVSIVTYSGSAAVALVPTAGNEKKTIHYMIDKLVADGSTNGGAGIQQAYDLAQSHFIKGGLNRVVLATDGDFNVGVVNRDGLLALVKARAQEGVYLSVLGLGTGNLKDGMMEALSNNGNGNYSYLDTLDEAKRVLVDNVAGTLLTLAKDVKIQVFFNPRKVAGYRLIGYENRGLAAREFNDDKKDAGDLGAGQTVTVYYELIPQGEAIPSADKVDANPFTAPENGPAKAASTDAWLRLRVRYKPRDKDKSVLVEQDVSGLSAAFDRASVDFRFGAAVAGFGMLLKKSPHAATLTWGAVEEIAGSAVGEDPGGQRKEFLELVRAARKLAGK